MIEVKKGNKTIKMKEPDETKDYNDFDFNIGQIVQSLSLLKNDIFLFKDFDNIEHYYLSVESLFIGIKEMVYRYKKYEELKKLKEEENGSNK